MGTSKTPPSSRRPRRTAHRCSAGAGAGPAGAGRQSQPPPQYRPPSVATRASCAPARYATAACPPALVATSAIGHGQTRWTGRIQTSIRLAESRSGGTWHGCGAHRAPVPTPGTCLMSASHRPLPAPGVLSTGAAAWFMAATFGQMAFVAFILVFFGSALMDGDPGLLNDKPHITGYVPGDVLGNAQFIGHALLGGLVTFAG